MIGDWGLGIGHNPQFPIPNSQSPIPIFIYYIIYNIEHEDQTLKNKVMSDFT